MHVIETCSSQIRRLNRFIDRDIKQNQLPFEASFYYIATNIYHLRYANQECHQPPFLCHVHTQFATNADQRSYLQ